MDCPVCLESGQMQLSSDGGRRSFACNTCGRFDVAGSAMPTLAPENDELTPLKRSVLSHRIRERNQLSGEHPLLTTYVLADVLANGSLPSPAIQASNLIKFVGDLVSSTGRAVQSFPPYIHALVGSPNRDFALRIARQLISRGLLIGTDVGSMGSRYEIIEVDLTLEGWESYELERQGKLSGRYGFIALKFGDEVLDPFLSNVIKPAVASIGYNLIDMRDSAQAGIIDNVMRSRIRDAAFVLVDLTHANAGAYWEAGYAEGLGKPVLYLCNGEVFKAHGTHFDTNHCTTIMWDPVNPQQFSEELVATLRRSLGLFG